MPSASNYTNKLRFAASVKNTKAQLPGNVGNLTQSSIAGCGLDIQYKPVEYVEVCSLRCKYSNKVVVYPPDTLFIDTVNITNNDISLDSPYGITTDPQHNIYVSDVNANKIYKISTSGVITTFAGTGSADYTGDGSDAIDATLNGPNDIVYNLSDDSLYVVDSQNNRVRIITSDIIDLFAGTGISGYNGDNQPATDANIAFPSGITYDNDGNIYVADVSNHRIRKIDNSGTITTIAGTFDNSYNGDSGNALEINLNSPNGLAFDGVKHLYITEYSGGRLRKLDLETGIITTILGPGISTVTTSNLTGVAIDSVGNLYVTDSGYNRVIKIITLSSETFVCAGDILPGYSGDKDIASKSRLNSPNGITIDSNGTIYISDTGNKCIRKLYYA